MSGLGNRPPIPNEVRLSLRVEEKENTVVINGHYSFMDVVRALKKNGYICADCNAVRVLPIGTGQSYSIPFSDPIMNLRLTEFVENVELYHVKYLKLSKGEFIYRTVFELK